MMTMLLLVLVVLAASPGLCLAALPDVVPGWAGKAPAIDGRLDDACWADAAQAGTFVNASSGRDAKWATLARISCDEKSFYVSFVCQLPPDTPEPVYRQDGAPVWQDESVELFITPAGSPNDSNLHQFVVNIAGAKSFLRIHEVQRDGQWQAAASRQGSEWTAEMRIPYSIFQNAGTNEVAWRIAFCRNAIGPEEYSSWPYVGGRFAYYWNYANLKEPKGHDLFIKTKVVPTPLKSQSTAGGVKAIRQAGVEAAEQPLIIPEPVSLKKGRGRFQLSPSTTIVIGAGADRMDARAAEVLADAIEQKCGFRPRINRSTSSSSAAANALFIGEPWLNPSAAALLKKSGDKLTASDPGEEGYVVRVTPSVAAASGSDRLGTFWAAQSLAQLVTGENGNWWIPAVVVRDKPAMRFRGAHLLTARDTLAFQKKLIREVLSPFKINFVVLQMDKFRWESHPEVADPNNSVSADDLRELIAFARDYHITYIPLVMSLGHMEWIFRGGHNLDIAEDPKHPYAYCPLNEKSYDLITDLFDEAYSVFGSPAWFHIGHDEFDMIGEFPTHEECRKLGKVELYCRDTLRLVEYLKSKGARAMMWGDILLKPGFLEDLDRLPKDVIIADWHYGPMEDYPSIDTFQKAGFEVIGCPWYLPANIYNFSSYAAGRKAIGMMQTTWSGWEPAEVVMRQWPEQMFQYVMGAEWAWSPGRPPLTAMTYEPDEVFKQRWFNGEAQSSSIKLAQGDLFTVGLAPYVNVSLKDTGKPGGWIGLGAGEDLSTLRGGRRRLGSVTYEVVPGSGKPNAVMLRGHELTAAFPAEVGQIAVGSKAKQLWFLQTTAFPDGPDRRIGSYRINYADGSSAEIPLKYGQNIMSWTDNLPTLAHEAAWRSATPSGRQLKLRAMPWDNPQPEKEIASITFTAEAGNQASPVLLAITGVR